MYEKLSGMTGTADTEAVEFSKIYKLDVIVIPTNKPIARIDDNDEVYLNEHDKWEAIAKEIKECHAKGQPILVGTVSIEKSELLSALLTKKGIRHEVLNAKNHAREALIIAEAGAKGSVTIATNMAGRGTDIKLGGNAEFRARKKAGTEASAEVFAQVLAKEKESWKKDYEEVKAAGGLYVIGTERHESRRIDNQLRGRSGRQGDPGRSKFFISMDDDLMRLFGGERMKTMMKRIGMPDGEAIFHPWLTKGIEKAQTKVELRNFEIRKHLLDYDDVLNEQRNYIYDQRDAILNDDNLRSRVMTTAEEVSEEYANTFKTMSRRDMATAFSHLQENLKDHFNFQLKSQDETSDVYNAMLSYFERDLNYKEALAGKENLNMFIRYQYVQAIDRRWLDHLEQLEALREAVYLRSYGSKNPLTEYKIDGFNIFYDMLDAIRLEIASRVFKVRVQTEDTSHRTSRKMQMNAQHNAMQSFDGMQARQAAAASPMASKRQGDNVTVVRSGPKVGRNDPCPCGSGKKYKQCCGR
jgi:preprotein translocase subunit SecA